MESDYKSITDRKIQNIGNYNILLNNTWTNKEFEKNFKNILV